MLEVTSYLKQTKDEINSYIEKTCFSRKILPVRLKEAMEYSLLAGGKRLRAILAIAVCRGLGGEDLNVFPVASAIEMIHCYSLIHDDLPAMDNDDFRRGKPSSHKKFGESIAILTGDALLTDAFYIIASQTKDKAIVSDLIEILSASAGIFGMVAGQVADVMAEEKISSILGEDQTQENLLDFIHKHKTGALIAVSCKVGALAAKTTAEDYEKISIYGEKIGLAFQIIDDILDICSTPEKLGKSIGKDIEQGKLTYPALWGMEKAKTDAKKLLEEANQAIYDIEGLERLKDIASFVVERDH